jgi:hypothetical protein
MLPAASGEDAREDVCDVVCMLIAGYCSGRARIVADDISANIKHKLTKEQKKVVLQFQ